MTDQKKQHAAENPYTITLFYQPAFFSSFMPAASGCPLVKRTTPDITPQVSLWIRHPAWLGYNPTGAILVNLKHTPNAYTPAHSNFAIEIDDHTHEYGCTSFGPSFPHAYASGGVYLSDVLVIKAIQNDFKACHSGQPPDVDLTKYPVDETLQLRWPAPSGGPPAGTPTRYHGFYGQQLGTGQYQNLWVVWHPGTWSPDGAQWRAPRKLWVPTSAVPDSAIFSKTKAGTGQAIYLEQNYATQIANLDVPKQPSGSGEGLYQLLRVAATDPPVSLRARELIISAAAKTRTTSAGAVSSLNVISEYAPGEIALIRDVVKPQVTIKYGKTLTDALSDYLKNNPKPPPFDNLDLIGHSRSRDKILKLGELALTARAAKTEFSRLADSKILEALQIKTIRLLGCRTATHPRGRHAARVIHQLTGLSVSAARTDLFAVHYDGSGLRPEATSLLADWEVISGAGPGDIPPSDDYPGALIPDDDDNHEHPIIPDVPKPDSFSLTALSNANAAMVSAKSYLFWSGYTPLRFKQLGTYLQADAEPDNPLLRAEYEVLLSISGDASMTFIRSFDLFLTDPQPRVRVNTDGTAFAFRFRDPGGLRDKLKALDIQV